jgi:ribosomal protein S27E
MLQEFLDVPNVQLCPSCGTRLAAPEWSESLSAGRTASVWCCQICSNSFLTPDGAGEKARSWDAHSNRAVEILRRTLFESLRRRFLNFVESCQR